MRQSDYNEIRWRFWGAIVLGALFLVVLLQNVEVVSIRFLFWEFNMSRIILLLLALMVGAVAGFVVGRKSVNW